MRARFHSIHDLLDRYQRSSGQDRIAMGKLLRRVIDANGGLPIIRYGDIFMPSGTPGVVAHVVGHEPRMIELPPEMRADNYVEYGPDLFANPA